MLNRFLNFLKKRSNKIEYNKFYVTIRTSSKTNFLIRYPRKDYGSRIAECNSDNWERLLNVYKFKPLFVDLYVSNSKKIQNLECELIIEEINNDNEVINKKSEKFIIGTDLESWNWKKFQLESILDYYKDNPKL